MDIKISLPQLNFYSYGLAHFRVSWYNFLTMAQTITVPTKKFEEILARLDQLTREVHTIKVKLFEGEPSYGSNAWWEWSDRKALEDIKEGRFTTLRNKKELRQFFNSLKSS